MTESVKKAVAVALGPLSSPHLDLGEILGGLLHRSHLLSPSDFAAVVAQHARGLGAEEVVLYLIDYSQSILVPLPSPDGADRTELAVDTTMPGRAFRHFEVLEGEATREGWRRMWVPLVDGTDRVGVLEMSFETGNELGKEVRDLAEVYAALVTQLLISQRARGDVFEFVRRRQPMALAAEVQWRLLPPLTFGTDNLVIAGALEPWQEVGGDAFDYAVNGEVAHLAVFDAMGHGVQATMLSSIAVGAYRNARRALLDLADTYRAVDCALSEHFDGERFVTALLAELQIHTGRLRWISAGHPAPLLLRHGKLLGNRLDVPPSLPLGLPFPADVEAVGEEALEPGDRLVLYTDGVVEARDADGAFFSLERLGEFVVREAASHQPAPEILRRLSRAILDHQHDKLQDDATTLLVEWRRGSEQALLTNGGGEGDRPARGRAEPAGW